MSALRPKGKERRKNNIGSHLPLYFTFFTSYKRMQIYMYYIYMYTCIKPTCIKKSNFCSNSVHLSDTQIPKPLSILTFSLSAFKC